MTPSLTPQESEKLHWHVKGTNISGSGTKDVIARVSALLTEHKITPSSSTAETITISLKDFPKLKPYIGLSDSTRSQLVSAVQTSRTREPLTPAQFLKTTTGKDWVEGPRYGDFIASPLIKDKSSGERFLKAAQLHIDPKAELIPSEQQEGSYRIWANKNTVLDTAKRRSDMGGFAQDISQLFHDL